MHPAELAGVLEFPSEFPGVDFAKLVKICLVHDLGEAISATCPLQTILQHTR